MNADHFTGEELEGAELVGARLEIHYAEEWAALYLDGKLVTVGDSYVAEEKAFTLLGVRTTQDPAFMRGQSQRAGVAQTLLQVAQYAADRDARIQAAAEKRAQAAALMTEAAHLDPAGHAEHVRQEARRG